MKTASELEAECRARDEKQQEAFRRHTLEVFNSSATIEPHVSTEQGNGTNYKNNRAILRSKLYRSVTAPLQKWRVHNGALVVEGDGGFWSATACDHCGTELWCDGSYRPSSPPKTRLDCCGCGWIRYIEHSYVTPRLFEPREEGSNERVAVRA